MGSASIEGVEARFGQGFVCGVKKQTELVAASQGA